MHINSSNPFEIQINAELPHFNITYDIEMLEPSNESVRMHVCQIYECTNQLTLNDSRLNMQEGFKIVQLSSMYINETHHDSDGAKYIDEEGRLIATHSPILIDGSSFSKTYLVTKIDGGTDVASLASGNFDKISAELGIRKSDIFQSDVIILVEGESDKRILNILADTLGLNLDKHNIEIMSVGGKDSMKFYANASAFKVSKTPFKVILDKDGNDPETIKRKLLGKDRNGRELTAPDEKAVCEEADIYILKKHSIESYLLDSEAISSEYGLNEEDVSQFLTSINREDKKSVLNELFKKFLDHSLYCYNYLKKARSEEYRDYVNKEDKVMTILVDKFLSSRP